MRSAFLCPFVLHLDCNDLDPLVNPRAVEICNGVDESCDDADPCTENDTCFDGTCSGNPIPGC